MLYKIIILSNQSHFWPCKCILNLFETKSCVFMCVGSPKVSEKLKKNKGLQKQGKKEKFQFLLIHFYLGKIKGNHVEVEKKKGRKKKRSEKRIHTQSIFIIQRFSICEFSYSLKFICNPNINILELHGCAHVHSSENRHTPSKMRQWGCALLSCSVLILWTSVLLSCSWYI